MRKSGKFQMRKENATLITVHSYISPDIFYSVWGIVYFKLFASE